MSSTRWLLPALVLSASVNLLVAGVLIGRAGMPREPAAAPMDWAAQSLSPETRRRVREQLREQMPAVRPLRQDLLSSRERVRRALAAEPFDVDELAAALETMRGVSGDYQALLHRNLVDLSQDLPRDQRLALARAVLERAGGEGRRSPPRPGA
jgi:uncharacterized membrane protein